MPSELLEKTEILYNALQKVNYLYTGLSIKKYLNKFIFSQKKDFHNPIISSGRWNSYAHYSINYALQNLLKKNLINDQSKVLIHPLLPEYLVEEILNVNTQPYFLDINKDTLNWSSKVLENYLNSQLVDLIVIYSFNGLYKDIQNLLDITFKQTIPVILIVDNPNFTEDLLSTIEKQKLGGVIINFEDSFLDNHLSKDLELEVVNNSWYISWQLETRTISVLEYHRSLSHQIILPFLEAYLYLMIEKYKKINPIGNLLKFSLSKFIFNRKFTNIKEAKDYIIDHYEDILELAIPDIIFDLEYYYPTYLLNKTNLEQMTKNIHHQSKKMYDYFVQAVKKTRKGTLEVPNFYLDQIYQYYFIYSTQRQHWLSELKELGYKCQGISTLHTLVKENKNLPNSNFIANYILLIDIHNYLKKN